MRNVRSDRKTVDEEVQTRIYIRSETLDQPAKALSNRRCQTIITIEPDEDIQTVRALFQFLPQQEIDKGAIHEIKLPRAALLQWKLPLTSYQQIKEEQVRHQKELSVDIAPDDNNNNITKSALKKKNSSYDNLGDWAALLALSHHQSMADHLIDEEIQTNFTVRPHVLGDDNVAQLAKACSLQTSLTFKPDASITDIQNVIIQDMDHLHAYISTITPSVYVNSSKEDVEMKESVIEPIIVPIKDSNGNDQTKQEIDVPHAVCECSDNTNPIVPKGKKVSIDPALGNENQILQDDDAVDEGPTLDQFIDMLLSELADKSVDQDFKDFVIQELADLTEDMTGNDPAENKVTNTDEDPFENVVAQIMNSCVYNIEDQLKRIVETFDTYQKDLQSMNKQINQPANAENTEVEAVEYSPQETRGIGEGPPIEMHGDFASRNGKVEVLCECCNLTAGGAAVPMLAEPPETERTANVTFDIFLDSDGIDLKNTSKSIPITGEQVIRFSINPSQPQVNQQGASASSYVQPNVFEIHVSRPDVKNVNVPSAICPTDLGTEEERECTVVLPPKLNLGTSEDNLDINGTSQKIGLMVDQDCDYVEPYISNVEDTSVPTDLLHPQTKPKNVKMIAKPIRVKQNDECNRCIEVPWELITLQIMVVEEENKPETMGCCRGYYAPSCTKTNCPMEVYNLKKENNVVEPASSKDDKKVVELFNTDQEYRETVAFHDKNHEIAFDQDDYEDDDMDYEPAFTQKSAITPSTSELHDSYSDLFVGSHKAGFRSKKRLIPVITLVYDPNFERHNEPYMDGMYNQFPDDYMEGNCGSQTEIPWDVFTVPTNAKIRKVKKTAPKVDKSNVNSNLDDKDKNNKMNVDPKKPNTTKEETNDFGISINFATDTISSVFFVDGAAATQKSISHYSMMSDFRYVAKRCPKNIAIGIDLGDGTIATILAGSESFHLAEDDINNISAQTMEIMAFTDCVNESEVRTMLKDNTGAGNVKMPTNGNKLTETSSLRASNVGEPTNQPKNVSQSMPEIPSRGTVTFPDEQVLSVVAPSTNSNGGLKPASNNADNDKIATALDAYRAEMKPLREALDKLKEEVRALNLPQSMPNYYGGYPQQFPDPNMQYTCPSVRHTTAISNGCATRTSTRMKPLFMQNMVDGLYNQMPYPPMPQGMAPPPPGMSPMPYYMPPQQYPSVPYQVPGMVPYPPPPMNQQLPDLYSHQEYTPTNPPPSCKTRRRKKRSKEGSVQSKESQSSQQVSESSKNKTPPAQCTCRSEQERLEKEIIDMQNGPIEHTEDASEVSIKANHYVISNNYKIEIAPDQAPVVQTQVATTETADIGPMSNASTHTETDAVPEQPPEVQMQMGTPETADVEPMSNASTHTGTDAAPEQAPDVQMQMSTPETADVEPMSNASSHTETDAMPEEAPDVLMQTDTIEKNPEQTEQEDDTNMADSQHDSGQDVQSAQ